MTMQTREVRSYTKCCKPNPTWKMLLQSLQSSTLSDSSSCIKSYICESEKRLSPFALEKWVQELQNCSKERLSVGLQYSGVQ